MITAEVRQYRATPTVPTQVILRTHLAVVHEQMKVIPSHKA